MRNMKVSFWWTGMDQTTKRFDDRAHCEHWRRSRSPQNPQNWTYSRKLLVTFQVCILNFGIYIGSSIYTPGELSIMEEFGVSEVVTTLGLCLFVL